MTDGLVINGIKFTPEEVAKYPRKTLEWSAKTGREPWSYHGDKPQYPAAGKGAIDSAKRARMHRALDAVLNGKAKDAKADGTYSPDEEADEKILLAKAAKAVADFRAEAYRIGGSFRGPGIWARVKATIKSVG